MAKIECKLRDLLDSNYECDRIACQNFIASNPDNEKELDIIRFIDTTNLTFIYLNDFHSETGYFMIDCKTGSLTTLYVYAQTVQYNEAQNEFAISCIVRKELKGSSSDYRPQDIIIPEKDYVDAMLSCAYLNQIMDVTMHPAIADKLQEVIDQVIKELNKEGKCISYPIITATDNCKDHHEELKLLFVDETVEGNPFVIGYTSCFGVSRMSSEIYAKIEAQCLGAFQTNKNIVVYVVTKEDELCFRIAYKSKAHIAREYNHVIIPIDTLSCDFFNEDIKDYFKAKITPKLQEYSSTSKAERISSSFMDDLFDW